MIGMQLLPQLWEGCEKSLRSRCMRGTTRWRRTLSVPALVSDAGTSKWGQVAVTLHARSQWTQWRHSNLLNSKNACSANPSRLSGLTNAHSVPEPSQGLQRLASFPQMKLHVR